MTIPDPPCPPAVQKTAEPPPPPELAVAFAIVPGPLIPGDPPPVPPAPSAAEVGEDPLPPPPPPPEKCPQAVGPFPATFEI